MTLAADGILPRSSLLARRHAAILGRPFTRLTRRCTHVKLIVGLGNPGIEYERTRHNAGFLVVDELWRRHAAGAPARGRFHSAVADATIAGQRCILMKPNTYMNRSGLAVGEALRFHKLDPASDLLVVVDDVALPIGMIRIRPSGGSGGHNGLADIERALGSDAYPRLRVGIDSGPGARGHPDFVLGRITDDEMQRLQPAIRLAADAAEEFIASGVNAAMNRFNARIRNQTQDTDPK